MGMVIERQAQATRKQGLPANPTESNAVLSALAGSLFPECWLLAAWTRPASAHTLTEKRKIPPEIPDDWKDSSDF